MHLRTPAVLAAATLLCSSCALFPRRPAGCDALVAERCGTNPYIKLLEEQLRVSGLGRGLTKEVKYCVAAAADVVYTRGLPAQPDEDLRKRFENVVAAVEGLKPRSGLFIMPGRQKACFSDPSDGGPFQVAVKEMLGL